MLKAAFFAVLQIFVALTVAAMILPALLFLAPGLMGPTTMLVVTVACVFLVFWAGSALEKRRERHK